MAATYSILLTAFTNGFDFNQFQNDIINSTIESTNPLQGIELPPDYVVLTFSGDLTENDTAYIDTIVANFVPVTVYSYTITPQGPPSVIADADYTINAYDISTRIIQITPTVQDECLKFEYEFRKSPVFICDSNRQIFEVSRCLSLSHDEVRIGGGLLIRLSKVD